MNKKWFKYGKKGFKYKCFPDNCFPDTVKCFPNYSKFMIIHCK